MLTSINIMLFACVDTWSFALVYLFADISSKNKCGKFLSNVLHSSQFQQCPSFFPKI